jgi:hypothetical protein
MDGAHIRSGAGLTQTRIRAGVWEGMLTGSANPNLSVTMNGEPLPGVSVAPLTDAPGVHAVRIPIPPAAISEGITTFLILDDSGNRLGHYTLAAGLPLDEDIRAEVDLLRAELDMLKRAFRRHCLDTMPQDGG